MAMSKVAWVVPTVADINAVLSLYVQEKANENITADSKPNDIYDAELLDRKDALLSILVEHWRGAIRVGQRTPLSLTAGSVPPEVKLHVLNMVAYQLVNSQPNLPMVVMGEGGVYAPLANNNRVAQTQLEAIQTGQRVVSYPTDPETETDADGVSRVVSEGGNSGEIVGEYDMSWEGSDTSGTVGYAINGTITDAAGDGVSGVLITVGTTTVTTDSDGAYSMTGMPNGTYRVVPTKTGCTFTPTNSYVRIANTNVTADFVKD